MFLDDYYKIIQNSRPKLKFCERFDDTSPAWNFSRHNHPYIELMYFFEGKGNLEVSGTRMSISLFDTVVYPAHWAHQEEMISEKRREIICLWVDLPELELKESIQLKDRDNTLSQLFRLIYLEAKREEPEPLLLEYEMKLLLTLILRNNSEGRDHKEELANALQYIHTHFTQKITLEQLADLEHISKSYLSRRFKKLTGMTVITYINHLRIQTAKRLLINSSQSVKEIAYQVGFESTKYFFRTFKSLTGESPSSFRNRHKAAAYQSSAT
ncbi:MAG: helix-turn-helix domain-containing protein [Caldicoprobacterales bacterium]|jgi:AraC-like DNA-binding protein|nr:helix-turn-helix transcriptional regulator [Clostridiales bacterium]